MVEPPKKQELDKNQQMALDDLLCDAVKKGNKARVVMCLRKGASTSAVLSINNQWNNVRKTAPLVHCAIESYNKDIFELLAKNGMPVDAKNSEGETALLRAVAAGDAVKAKALLDFGANPLEASRAGVTVLGLAYGLQGQGSGREEIIDLLLEKLPDARREFNIHALDMTLDKPVPVVKSISFSDKKSEKPSEKIPGKKP